MMFYEQKSTSITEFIIRNTKNIFVIIRLLTANNKIQVLTRSFIILAM